MVKLFNLLAIYAIRNIIYKTIFNMDILERLKLRIEFEKKQSGILYSQEKLNVNILRTYTRDTIAYLIKEHAGDIELVKTLVKIHSDLDTHTRIIQLDSEHSNIQESDTVCDFVIDENTLVSDDDIFDTCSEFELFEDTLPGVQQRDESRIVATQAHKVFCHIGYKTEEDNVLCKSENQDYIHQSQNHLVVCDGVGSGLNSKDISEFVGSQFANFIDSFIVNMRVTNEFSRSSFIQHGVLVINQQVIQLIESKQFVDGNSGTTLSSAFKVGPNSFHISAIGDSPIYLFDLFNGIRQLNTDDTILNKLKNQGYFVNNPMENSNTINLLSRMWPNDPTENLLSIAKQCIVKSFGFKQSGVLFSENNNQTIHLESTSGILICSDGISDQFNLDGLYSCILLGGIKEMITEFNLLSYSHIFNYTPHELLKILNSNITQYSDLKSVKVIYRSILNKLFYTYGFSLLDIILKGGIKEASKEALLAMKKSRIDFVNANHAFLKPKSDNISIGYII